MKNNNKKNFYDVVAILISPIIAPKKHGNLKSLCSPNEGIRSKRIVAKNVFQNSALNPHPINKRFPFN